MDIFMIFTSAFVVGLSGAMMPGPVTAVVAHYSLRRGFVAGPMIVLGHAVLEVFIVALILLGLGRLISADFVAGFLGLGGGFILAWMGYVMIKKAYNRELSLELTDNRMIEDKSGPFIAGIVTSITNPYWFVWWMTIGAGYVIFASEYGLKGILSFFTGHILSDLAWFSLMAFLFVSGKRFLTDRIYSNVIGSLGVFLVIFAIYFFFTGVKYIF